LCPTLRNPMDCSPPGSSIHGIFQARVIGINGNKSQKNGGCGEVILPGKGHKRIFWKYAMELYT